MATYGERNPSHKLNRAAVKAIRYRYATGAESQVELARLYGVKQPNVSRIIRGETWKHLLVTDK